MSCLFRAGDWWIINCLVLGNVYKQLPLQRSAGGVQETWTRVYGKGERVQRLPLGMVWRWIMSLLVLKVPRMVPKEEIADGCHELLC